MRLYISINTEGYTIFYILNISNIFQSESPIVFLEYENFCCLRINFNKLSSAKISTTNEFYNSIKKEKKNFIC